MDSYRLFELNEYIRRFVALNLPTAIWVSAELASVDERKGHYYLSLIEKDEDADQLIARTEAVMWKNSAKSWQRQNRIQLGDLLQAGRKLKLLAQVEFHERYGLKLIVSDLDPNYTLGQLEQARQATLQHLAEQHLLDANSKLPLKQVPQRLAIISSPVAAGLQDFLQQLAENSYGYTFHTQLFPAAMQGPQASPEIRRQLRTIGRRASDYDAIVIIRGGGSRIDLADFDGLELCVAAAQSSLPIISGIGHDIDQSILDRVAHTSLKTPTAAAIFLLERFRQFEEKLEGLAQYLAQHQLQYLQSAGQQLLQYEQQLQWLGKQQVQRQQWRLEQYEQQVQQAIQNQLKTARSQLQLLDKKHELLKIETSLNRGFSIISKSGKIISSKKALAKQDELEIYFKDGRQSVKTTKI